MVIARYFESCYSFDEAASKFNSHFDGYFDYAYNGWENYCADCAIDYAEDRADRV